MKLRDSILISCLAVIAFVQPYLVPAGGQEGYAFASHGPYYIDPVNGDDSKSGLSSSQAWKTLSRVSSASFGSGAQIKLKRGGVWREELKIPRDGLSFSAYATGPNPVIKGSDIFKGWSQVSLEPLLADSFESGSPHSAWSEALGSLVGGNLVNGQNAYRINSKYDQLSLRDLSYQYIKQRFSIKVDSSSIAGLGKKVRWDLCKSHPDYVVLWLSHEDDGLRLGVNTSTSFADESVPIDFDTVYNIEVECDTRGMPSWKFSLNGVKQDSGTHQIEEIREVILGSEGYNPDRFQIDVDDVQIFTEDPKGEPVHSNDFESSGNDPFWESSTGSRVYNRSLSGSYAYEIDRTEEKLSREGQNYDYVRHDFKFRLDSGTTASSGHKVRWDLCKNHPNYVVMWLTHDGEGYQLGMNTSIQDPSQIFPIETGRVYDIQVECDTRAVPSWTFSVDGLRYAHGTHQMESIEELLVGFDGYDANLFKVQIDDLKVYTHDALGDPLVTDSFENGNLNPFWRYGSGFIVGGSKVSGTNSYELNSREEHLYKIGKEFSFVKHRFKFRVDPTSTARAGHKVRWDLCKSHPDYAVLWLSYDGKSYQLGMNTSLKNASQDQAIETGKIYEIEVECDTRGFPSWTFKVDGNLKSWGTHEMDIIKELVVGFDGYDATSFKVQIDDVQVFHQDSVRDPNVWSVSVPKYPTWLYYDGKPGRERFKLADLNEEGDWYWDPSGELFLYSFKNPDTAYTSPGVEISQRRTVSHNQHMDTEFSGIDFLHNNSLTDSRFTRNSLWNTKVPSGKNYRYISGLSSLTGSLTSWNSKYQQINEYSARISDPQENIYYCVDAFSRGPGGTGEWKRSDNPSWREQDILVCAESLFREEFGGHFYTNIYSVVDGNKEWFEPGAWPSLSTFNELVQPSPGPAKAYVPANAVPGEDGDGHLAIHQPDGLVLEVNAGIRLSSGELVALMYSFTDPSGDGTGALNGRRASLIPNYAGLITDKEMVAGLIPHALSIILPPELLREQLRSPALAFDAEPGYSGSVPMGSRLALSPSVDLNSLGLSRDGLVIAKALQDYGGFVTDRGGKGGGWLIGVSYLAKENNESGLGTYNYSISSDLAKIASHLKRVDD